MRKANLVMLAVVMAVMAMSSANLLAQQPVIIDYNAVIGKGDLYDVVVIKGDDTVVDITGGMVNIIITMNGSTLNISGGQAPRIRTHDTSTVNVSGGETGFENVGGSSHVNISGAATVSNIVIDASAVVSVAGGTVANAYLYSRGRMIITGGMVHDVSLQHYSRIDISGGGIGSVSVWTDTAFSEPVLNVIGNRLSALPYSPTDAQQGMVTGRWNDGTPFTIATNSLVYNYVALWDGVIPTDCVKEPVSDASGDCKVDLADLAMMSSEWLDDGAQ